MDLWSTFTYYLRDPINGDQMLQHDDPPKSWLTSFLGAPTTSLIGIQARMDDIKDVGIFSSFERQITGTTQNAGVSESNGAIYAETHTQWLDQVQTTLGLREDQFGFDVKDKMLNPDGSCNIDSDPLGCVTGTKRAAIFSPKLGLMLFLLHTSNRYPAGLRAL